MYISSPPLHHGHAFADDTVHDPMCSATSEFIHPFCHTSCGASHPTLGVTTTSDHTNSSICLTHAAISSSCLAGSWVRLVLGVADWC